ncbi:Gfo/Idh/MocA family oxidoreductase [Tunturibacter empetritectus]|uniref:Gfo/Idh/MocA family oxidoreductase n=1 Tax=Tunturiibacter empetritectus TaxID=3069691 RepID=A0AAU7ZHF5_9BACT
MTQQPVRFAILGFGHHAIRRLLPAFPRCEQSTLSGMWRRDHAAAIANCAEYKIPHCFATREELCSSPDVDVVFITSPDAMHRDDTLLALKHGKAVLCEKPLTMSTAQAKEMNAAASASGLLFGVAQNFRYNRSLEWMRDQIAAGLIGTPQLARAEYCYPATNSARKWIIDATLAYGGPIGDVGVHCIDALRFVLGNDVISVDTLARKDASSGNLEAIASLQMEMTGDIFATVTTSARAPYRSLVEVNGNNGVMTAEGCLTVDRPVEIVVRRAGEVVERVTLDNGDGYTRMLDSFAAALRSDGDFAATGEDGLHNMRALDAAIASWRSGSRQNLRTSADS